MMALSTAGKSDVSDRRNESRAPCANIPTTMTAAGMDYLRELAAGMCRGALLMDIGAFYGAATCVMAVAAPAPARIYAVDTWQAREWMERWVRKVGAPPFSREAFENFTGGLEGIIPLQGRAQDVLRKLDERLDFIFIDAVGNDPDFSDILTAAVAALRPGGVVCGEGYSIRFPDIVRNVKNLAGKWRGHPVVKGRVWALQAPLEKREESPGLADILRVNEKPGLMVTSDCDFEREWQALPECWGGRPAEAGGMRAFRLDWVNRPQGVDVRCRCAAAGFPTGPHATSGDWCQVDESRPPIISVWMELTGPRAGDYELFYQAGFARDGTAPFEKKHYSRTVPGGSWIRSPSRGTPINALRVIVRPRDGKEKEA